MDFAYCFRTKKSRFSSPSCESGLCVLLSYLKVAIFKPRLRKWTLRTTFVLKSCDFQAPAAKVDFAYYFLLRFINRSTYLSTSLSPIYLSTSLFIYLCISLSIQLVICLSIYKSIYLCLSLFLYLFLSISLAISISVY